MKGLNPTSEQPKTALNVKALTWLRDSHGLFDYESFQLTKNSLNICSPCSLIRSDGEVRMLSCPTLDPTLGDIETIGTITSSNGNSQT